LSSGVLGVRFKPQFPAQELKGPNHAASAFGSLNMPVSCQFEHAGRGQPEAAIESAPMRGSVWQALQDTQSSASVPRLTKRVRPQKFLSKDLSRVGMGWAQVPPGFPRRVGLADSRFKMIAYFSNNLQKKTTDRESTMRPANNPFNNRQAPKRNHEKLDYQNEKTPSKTFVFILAHPPFPMVPCF
jgi:hypothetical protein